MTILVSIFIGLVVIIGILTLWLIGYCAVMTKVAIAANIECARLRELFVAYAGAKAKTDEAQTNAIIQLEYRNACADKAVADHLSKTNPPVASVGKDKTDKPN